MNYNVSSFKLRQGIIRSRILGPVLAALSKLILILAASADRGAFTKIIEIFS